MEVLSRILGESSIQRDESSSEHLNDYVEDFLVHHRNKHYQVTDSELRALKECEYKKKTLIAVHEEFIPPICDDLEKYGSRLQEFTADLWHIKEKAAELKTILEYNSNKLSTISPMVNDLIIPPKTIDDILNGKINSHWKECVAFVQDKMAIYSMLESENNGQNSQLPKDFDKMKEILHYLKLCILERSKRYIINHIKAMRNQQPVPSQRIQKAMLPVRELFQFIADNNYSLALELRQAYAYTMKWYYKEYFSRYVRSLCILKFKNIDSQYALGNGLSSVTKESSAAEGSYIASYFLPKSTLSSIMYSVTEEDINSYFAINKRISVLTQEDNTVMVSQIAENNQMENFLEVGFKNLNLALLDNCTVEFQFLQSFFSVKGNNEEMHGLLEKIFQPTFDLAMDYISQLIQYTYDIFGILISIRIANRLHLESRGRGLPEMFENFLNGQLLLLWPKFQQLIDFQCENMKNSELKIKNSKSSHANIDQNNDSTTFTGPLISPHEFTIQFSNFLTSLLTLSKKESQDTFDERSEPLYNSTIRLRNEFETVIRKTGKKTSSSERFLATNFLYVYNILQQKYLDFDQGKFSSEESSTQHPSMGSIPLIVQDCESYFKKLVEEINNGC